MKIKIILCVLLCACFAACAFALPAVTVIELGKDVEISASDAEFDAPDAGEWLSYVASAVSGDETLKRELCTAFALNATELGYNNYQLIKPQEKAVIAYTMLQAVSSQEVAMFFADETVDPSVIPVCAAPDGNYALLTYDGEWKIENMFALTGGTDEVGFTCDFGGAMGDEKLAVLGKETDGAWQIVGINMPLLTKISNIAYFLE